MVFSARNLPSGLRINPTTGLVTGTLFATPRNRATIEATISGRRTAKALVFRVISRETIEFVPVGFPGSRDDPVPMGGPDPILIPFPGTPGSLAPVPERPTGRVDRVFEIGKFEVTNDQSAEFLNAVATIDRYGLFSGAELSFMEPGGPKSIAQGEFPHAHFIGVFVNTSTSLPPRAGYPVDHALVFPQQSQLRHRGNLRGKGTPLFLQARHGAHAGEHGRLLGRDPLLQLAPQRQTPGQNAGTTEDGAYRISYLYLSSTEAFKEQEEADPVPEGNAFVRFRGSRRLPAARFFLPTEAYVLPGGERDPRTGMLEVAANS